MLKTKLEIHGSLQFMSAVIMKNDIRTCDLKAEARWLIKFRKSVSQRSLNLWPSQNKLRVTLHIKL